MKAMITLPLARTLSATAASLLLSAPLLLPATVQAQPASQAASSADVAEIQRLIKESQHAQALKLIDESLAKNPKDPQMRFRRGVAPAMTFDDGLEVVELLMTAYLSAEQERTVAWKPEGLEHFVPAVARGAWRPV